MKSTLRVLHFIEALSAGGAERQLVDIVSNTSSIDLEHTVCTLKSDNFFEAELAQSGTRVISLDLQSKRPWLGSARKAARVVDEIRPDVIHSWLFGGDVTARVVKLLRRGIPLITSLQSPAYETETIVGGNLSAIKVNAYRLIDLGLAKLTDPYFVACSRFVARSAEERLGVQSSRISVIYNTVDPRSISCDPREPKLIRKELGIPTNAFVYISVGRLDAGKGFANLINAFYEVAARLPEAYLVIVGDGILRQSIFDLINELGLSERTILAGRRRNIGAFLEMADVFVFPTLFEGLGIALLEAMYKRLPSIASRLPVITEVLTDGNEGILAEPGNKNEWIAAMMRLYEDADLRERFRENGRKKVEQTFSSPVVMPLWVELYKRISNT